MTILRAAEHAALRTLTLTGNVLDLGGDTRSEYRTLIQGNFTITTANIDEKTKPDLIVDLEQSLPVADGSYDAVLLINVLEHIFNYRDLLAESVRALRPGGTLVIVVPYLFPYHPSPNDYYRFSKVTLEKLLAHVGAKSQQITPLGSGVFAARWLFLERLIPSALQDALGLVMHPLVHMLDELLMSLARGSGKLYQPSDYALGFLVTATKHD